MDPKKEQANPTIPPGPASSGRQTLIYLVTLLLPVALLFSLLTFFIYRQQVQTEWDALRTMEVHHVQLLTRSIDKDFTSIFSDLRFLARQNGVRTLQTQLSQPLRAEVENEFLRFSQNKSLYDQIRFIDLGGKEIVRVNHNNGQPVIVPQHELQNKISRYYVDECSGLKPHEIYISPFDLNIEHGQLEMPLKPMIRFCTQITSAQGIKQGLLVFNYLGQQTLNDILSAIDAGRSTAWLLNQAGYWLSGPSAAEEWGFMYPDRQQLTFASRYPDEWETISTTQQGQLSTPAGLFTFATILPFTPQVQTGATDRQFKIVTQDRWKIMTFVPHATIASARHKILQRLLLINLFVGLTLSLWGLLLVRARHKRNQALTNLERARAELEIRVAERTEILSKTIASLEDEIDKRAQAEDRVRQAEQIWEQTFNALADLITIHDLQMNITHANTAAVKTLDLILGQQFDGDCVLCLEGCIGEGEICPGITALRENRSLRREIYEPTRDTQLEIRVIPIPGSDHRPGRLIHITRDVGEMKVLEEQIRQAHKMEAIGTLSGGIAHDFNNILAIMIGNAEMGVRRLPLESPALKHLHILLQAAERAKTLVRQILTFSRKEESEQKLLDPKLIMLEIIELLRSTLPSSVELESSLEENPPSIKANATQIHQILMNLATNALQAMTYKGIPKGRLSLSLGTTMLTLADLHHRPLMTPGQYLQISLTDTGCGIPPELLEHIFDPFFTTKDLGEGTGLGLSLVYGIIEGHGGMITVASAPGAGTRFEIYLPAATLEAKIDVSSPEPKEAFTGDQRILWVDDEEEIVDIGRQILEDAGYRVTTASDGLQALELFSTNPGGFDLIITDMSMPRCTGAELAEKLLALKPELPIILCTGYTSAITEKRLKEIGIFSYYQKPLTRKEILQTVKTALSAQGSSTPQV